MMLFASLQKGLGHSFPGCCDSLFNAHPIPGRPRRRSLSTLRPLATFSDRTRAAAPLPQSGEAKATPAGPSQNNLDLPQRDRGAKRRQAESDKAQARPAMLRPRASWHGMPLFR